MMISSNRFQGNKLVNLPFRGEEWKVSFDVKMEEEDLRHRFRLDQHLMVTIRAHVCVFEFQGGKFVPNDDGQR